MKKLTLGILCCFLSASTFAKPVKLAIDQIVAVVNDDVVTRSELNSALNSAKMQIAQEHIAAPSDKMLTKQVLDQVINKKLQLQIAKQSGVQVTDADLNVAIQQVAEQNNISVAALYERLGQEGMSKTTYQNEMRDQLAMQKLQQQEVVSRINISQEEIESFMRSTAWQNNSTKEYRIFDMLVPVSDTPSPQELAEAKKRAVAILAKAKTSGNFKSVAAGESGGAHALQGGDLGWRKLPEIPSAFAEQIASMKPNDMAGPIQTPNGFHVIQLAELRASTDTETSAQNNRKQVERLLMQRKFEEAIQNWVSKLRSQSFIQTKITV